MISIVLYGRNDSYGYNLHKRAALGINCMAEVLSAPTDEILFVDYNTPDDHPTFPEAIADTLTDRAVARLRIFRVRPAIHDRFKGRTHLKALEPHARNVAVRRSNPANRWILSTNTDMIFVPRGRESVSEIAAGLAPGFYHLPRFELPESLWEGFDRRNPAAVIEQARTFGRTLFLNEIVYGAESIKYDAPGDFQLILREDLFRIDGFNEDMLLGWHVDSNIAKRLYLMYGVVGDVVDRLFGYHCDHTRQVTPMHQHGAAANDGGLFIDRVVEPGLPQQAATWGCADDQIEELRLSRTAHHVYLDGLSSVMHGEWAEPVPARYTFDSYDQTTYDSRHVLPFLIDLFASAPRQWTAAWLGGRADTFQMFCRLWERLGFTGGILIDEWCAPLLAPGPEAGIRITDTAGLDNASVFIFDFGALSDTSNPFAGQGITRAQLDAAVERVARRSFHDLAARERARMLAGSDPRRFVCVNAIHNRYESLAKSEIGAASTPFATRLRHGFVMKEPSGLAMPPEPDTMAEGTEAADLEARANVLGRMPVSEGGRRSGTSVAAPFGRRGYVIRGFPYERLMPGTYQVEFAIEARHPLTPATSLRPVILEVVAGERYLARERVNVTLGATPSLTFTIPDDRPDGVTGVEVRIFRGRWVDFAITGLRIWRLPSPGTATLAPIDQAGINPLLQALGLGGSAGTQSV